MGKLRGFLEIERRDVQKRPVAERVNDWNELELPVPDPELRDQAARCMDCGIPFCHDGCPLGNLIPDFNHSVYEGRFSDAIVELHRTNNFPEFTGRVCPAPCEASCVLNIEKKPVTIKNVERGIIDRAWDAGLVVPIVAERRTGKTVAVVGSGPAGLAAAQELARRGHDVTVFERDDRIGGLLRYGIPDFKMEKYLVDRRVAQMRAEGVTFRTSVSVGVDVTAGALRDRFDAIVLSCGARRPRDLPVPGRDARGIHFAMDYLTQQNKRGAGDIIADGDAIVATGKRVVVIGGGDTGADCVGTSHRQRAASVVQLELMARHPDERAPTNPWPEWPLIHRTSSSHEEGAAREFAISTTRFLADDAGNVRALEALRVRVEGGRVVPVEGTAHEIPCELVLLAMGFTGAEREPWLEQLGVALDARGNVATTSGGRTSAPGVFAAGDMARGQSLVVWAIAEGRRVAHAVHDELIAPARRRLSVAG